MKVIKGYRVLDIPLNANKTAIHHLFVREHTDKTSQAPGRTLFVGNIDCTIDLSHEEVDSYLRVLFGRFGAIESVSVSAFGTDQTDKTRFSHLVFAKKSSLKLAINGTDNDYEHAVGEVAKHLGFLEESVPKSIADIKSMFAFFDTDPDELKEEVNEFMREFDENEQLEIQQHNSSLNVPDADGFITVGSRSKRKRDTDTVAADKVPPQKLKNRMRKKKRTELKNFYRFQIRDDKMKQLDVLRKKFEEDKDRVTKMKEARKFNPF